MLTEDQAWADFISTIDPQRLEQERFGRPGPDERPGSWADRRMRKQHAERLLEERIRRRHPTASREQLAAAVAEASTYDERRSYAARRRARAQEREAS